jgi:putative transport protein
MTSTPRLAAALEACEAHEVAASYGATYPVALISMILFTTIMTYIA